MVEAPAGQTRQAAAEEPEPDVARASSTSMAVTACKGSPSSSFQTFTTLPVGLSIRARPSSVPTQTRGPSTLTAKMWSFGSPSFTVKCFQCV